MVMKSTTKRHKSSGGFTFAEVMGAILVLTIAVLGASAYRYHAALDTRKADLQTTAARMASLLCETWRGTDDPNTFDPVASFGTELAITPVDVHDAPRAPTGLNTLGTYSIVANDVDYRTVLFWRDVQPGLRALSVVVVWDWNDLNYSNISYRDNKTFKLTTYVLY
jgi:hypothetical protein